MRPVGTDPVNREGSSQTKRKRGFSGSMDGEWRNRLKQRRKKVKQIEYSPDWVEKMHIQKKFHTMESRRKSAAKGHALPNNSYPIEDTEDLKNAATLARTGHGDVAAAKRLIARRARDFGVPNPLTKKEGVAKSADFLDPTYSCFFGLTE